MTAKRKVNPEDLSEVTELITDVQRISGTLKMLHEKSEKLGIDKVYFPSLAQHDDESGDLLIGTTPVNLLLIVGALKGTLDLDKRRLSELGVEIGEES